MPVVKASSRRTSRSTSLKTAPRETSEQHAAWPDAIHAVFKAHQVKQVAYVPDGGHAQLIRSVEADKSMRGIVLTTEEEGIALAAGAWLGGERAALLMQSSGVGNCINMLSLIKTCRFPFLTLITMRGEWGEFNHWQVPMASSTQASLELMDLHIVRAERPDEVHDVVHHAAAMAYQGGSAVAVLLAQRLVGSKVFVK